MGGSRRINRNNLKTTYDQSPRVATKIVCNKYVLDHHKKNRQATTTERRERRIENQTKIITQPQQQREQQQHQNNEAPTARCGTLFIDAKSKRTKKIRI